MRILGELDRAGVIHRDVRTVHAPSLGAVLDEWDIARAPAAAVQEFYRAAPGGVRTTEAFSQSRRYPSLDLDRAAGVVRDPPHAFSEDGGLAVLYGNLAPDGCIVKTAGVDKSVLTFSGRALVFESENSAAIGILAGKVQPGHVVIIRYEGPRGGPGMQEMLKPTGLLKGKGLAATCALVTDGRFSGATSGLSIGHGVARGGLGRRNRARRGRRRDRHRHSGPHDPARRARRRTRAPARGDGGSRQGRMAPSTAAATGSSRRHSGPMRASRRRPPSAPSATFDTA